MVLLLKVIEITIIIGILMAIVGILIFLTDKYEIIRIIYGIIGLILLILIIGVALWDLNWDFVTKLLKIKK